MSSTSPSVVPQQPLLNDIDLYAWSHRQAALIRAGRLDELDLDRLAGEIDAVGSEISERLESALTFLFMHMLKWDHQPDHRSRSWEATIREQRKRIAKLLKDNPSLKSKLDDAQDAGCGYGRDRASGETDMPVVTFPEKSPYNWQDITAREYQLRSVGEPADQFPVTP